MVLLSACLPGRRKAAGSEGEAKQAGQCLHNGSQANSAQVERAERVGQW